MKVAVLNLGTALARLCKPSAPPQKQQPPPPPSPSPPARSAALAPAVGPSLAGASRSARPPGQAGGIPGSPRSARDPGGAWAAPGKHLLFTLPGIGEEGAPDEEDSAPSKGLSKGTADRCSQGKSEDSLPAPFMKTVQEAIDSCTFTSLSSLLSSGQTTPIDLNHSWSGIQSCTTGPSTERSSIYSWRDDEFDKANTQRVHQLFWDVDEMLFEGKVSSQIKGLKAECKEWTNRSLHLRVLGKQLLFPNDEGFQHFQSRNVSSVYSRSLPSLSEISTSSMKELSISGSKLIPEASPVQKSFSSVLPEIPLAESLAYSFLEEEIYDAEGKIEEYLAFDNKDIDDENLEQKKSQLAQKRTKYGIPPVSPNACIKDAVALEVFDHVWKNIIEVLAELIRKYWESSIAENDKRMVKMKAVGNKLPHLPISRITVDTSSVPPSRGSEARGTSLSLHFVPSQSHRFPSNIYSDLNGVMTIQAKPLQQRHSGLTEKIQNEQEDRPQGVASTVNSARNRQGRISDNGVFSSSRVLQGSSRKTLGHRRLPSIVTEPLRSKTPNVYSDEVLRGRKLCTALDRLSLPLPPTARNKLPPISSEAVDQYLSIHGSRQAFHRGRYPHSRISSAVPDSTERRPLRERTVIIDQFSRPNTTHTFRSDTSHKRSLTSMDFANHMWTGQGVLTGSQFHAKSVQKNPPASRRRFQVVS